MSHHTHRHSADAGCPTCGHGATAAPGGNMPGMQAGGWPSFAQYGRGYAPFFPGYQAGPTGPMHDKDILRMVAEYLRSDPRLAPEAEFTVDVTHGVVTLNGTVPDKWTKYYAGDDCFSIPAVVDVANHLKIGEVSKEERKPRSPSRRPKEK